MKPEKYLKNYINGQLVPPISGQYINLYNPAIGEVYAYAPDSSQKDVNEAVEAAAVSAAAITSFFMLTSRIRTDHTTEPRTQDLSRIFF